MWHKHYSQRPWLFTSLFFLFAHLPTFSHTLSAARTERKLIADTAAEAGVSLRAMIDVKRRREKAVAERAGAVEAAASARVQHRYVMFELFRAEEAEFFRRHAMRSRFTQVCGWVRGWGWVDVWVGGWVWVLACDCIMVFC
jgi:hypothetical protein